MGRCSTQSKEPIGANKATFWACFTPIGVVDVVMLPPGETFDRSFFVDNFLEILKKKLAQIPDVNPEKSHFCIWTMPTPIWPITKFKQITRPGCPIQLTARFCPARFLLFGYLKMMLEVSSFERAEELQEKVTNNLMSNPTSTFKAVFEEQKSQLLRCIEANGEYHKRKSTIGQDFPHSL
jgi:hypothetical protein